MESEIRTQKEICYKMISNKFSAYLNCQKTKNYMWQNIHEQDINQIGKLFSGSGFSDLVLSFGESKDKKLVFYTSFHHMNNDGYYDGFSDLIIKVFPVFSGIDFTITGINRKYRFDKEYYEDTIYHFLTKEIIHTYNPKTEISIFTIQNQE